MKVRFLLLLLISGACSSDNDLNDIPVLNGMVGGGEWSYKFGNSFRSNSGRTLDLSFFSTEETATDACTIATTGNTHLTMTVPNTVGNYNLPNNGESIVFHQENSTVQFEATSGFIEIFEILPNQVSGFMQAQFDDGNTVEGQFRLKPCN